MQVAVTFCRAGETSGAKHAKACLRCSMMKPGGPTGRRVTRSGIGLRWAMKLIPRFVTSKSGEPDVHSRRGARYDCALVTSTACLADDGSDATAPAGGDDARHISPMAWVCDLALQYCPIARQMSPGEGLLIPGAQRVLDPPSRATWLRRGVVMGGSRT